MAVRTSTASGFTSRWEISRPFTRHIKAAPTRNTRFILTTLVVVGSVYASAFAQIASVAPRGTVYRVIDGDTIELTTSGQRLGIGIVGVRAPAGNTACGRLATAWLWELSAEGLWFDEQADIPHERFRVLYYVFTPDGRSVAEQMVQAGLAWTDGRGRERAALEAAENDARASRRGCLWQ